MPYYPYVLHPPYRHAGLTRVIIPSRNIRELEAEVPLSVRMSRNGCNLIISNLLKPMQSGHV